MKKTLFIMEALECGGAEKSLISLLETIDKKRYQVELLLFQGKGLFMPLIPEGVHVRIVHSKEMYTLTQRPTRLDPRKVSMKAFWSRTRMWMYYRMHPGLPLRRKNQYLWKSWRRVLPALEEEYDVAIGFLPVAPTYYAIEKVRAKKKIGWIHSDYLAGNFDLEMDFEYFSQLDSIVTVSEQGKRSLDQAIPALQEKSVVIQNIVNPAVIRSMAEAEEGFNDQFQGVRILTVGRVSHEKGIDMAVEACKILRDEGRDVRWYCVGDGDERKKLEALVQIWNLQDHFVFCGVKANPYPMMKECDIYVQPSRFEGKSIAIDEAKCLHKPVITTNYPTACDQIKHKVNGYIVEMSAQGIAVGIITLMEDKQLCREMSDNLKKEDFSNREEVEKLYAIIEQ